MNKQIAKLEVRSRKLTNALRCKDDEVAELYLRDADEIFGKGRIELITTFDFLKEFEDYQEQVYEKYVNEKK